MKSKQNIYLSIIICTISCSFYGQDVSLYKQYNGRYDFVFIGNTLNTIENNSVFGEPDPPCVILTSSSALLNLNSNDSVENAYLYWAGSGTGDFDVKLNGQNISAQRTFSNQNTTGFPFFSAFADVTSIIKSNGNGTYNFSDLDLTDIIEDYCDFGGNFGGWAIVIVYKNAILPLNQLNVYDGMQSVPREINITLNSLNVIDTNDAKIGFVAWEGDKNIAINESLLINGNLIDNPPLNPGNNAFNGTNSFLGTSDLFNMDLDVYNIRNNINIGDTNATIKLTSNQDFVMINAIVTKLNSQLPDATVKIKNINKTCNSKKFIVDYTVSNLNSTNPLIAGIPIAIYVNNILLQKTKSSAIIPIDGIENASISLIIPENFPFDYELKFVVDDVGTGLGNTIEIDENNNLDLLQITYQSTTKKCAPVIYNFVSANNDTKNDTFFIEGLRDNFVNFKLFIYNRWGTLVWTGDINTPDWDGHATKGVLIDNSEIPAGTYFYILELNDPDYPKPLEGYLFLTR